MSFVSEVLIVLPIHSFIHLFSVDLLQGMEIVMSIIAQEKSSSIQYIHVKLYQYV